LERRRRQSLALFSIASRAVTIAGRPRGPIRRTTDVPSFLQISTLGPGYGSLADPPGSSVLVAAVSWIEGTMLGTIATSAAIVAVAAVGFMMLSGRLSVRPGLAAVVGSFILFGASTIAAGIRASAGGGEAVALGESPSPPPVLAPAPARAPPAAAPPSGYDPHAGASVLSN
jgi:type IV secretory pathway VirB2 component (pilin)